MNLGRLWRTVGHLTPGQVGWRLIHEARLATYRRAGNLPALWWRPDAQARFVGSALDATPFAAERAVAELWRAGEVSYLGRRGRRDDWQALDQVKLWRYERQYHRELVALAALAQVEPDGPWLADATTLVATWAAACPPARGDAWEPYPVARRILSWSLAGCLVPMLGARLAAQLAPQLRFLDRHLERHLLGNHLLCDATALVAGAAVLEAAGAAHIGERALTLLTRELQKQVLADGGYGERTMQYHSIVAQDAMIALGLWRRRGREVPEAALEVVRRMLAFVARVRRADGSLPWLNDAAPDATPPPAQLFALAHALGLGELLPATDAAREDVTLADTGWQIVRRDGDELLFDCGPLGPDEQPGHGHSDTLGFELIWQGQPIVLDSGVTTYQADDIRAFERSALAHAVLTVAGRGADELWAAFRVGARGSVIPGAREREGALRRLHGTLTSPSGWTHARTIVYEPARAFVVVDRVRGAASGDCRLRLPLAPGVALVGERLESAAGSLGWTVLCGRVVAVEQGSIGAGFGQRQPRSVIAIEPDADGRAIYGIFAPGVALARIAEGARLSGGGPDILVELG